MESRVLLFQVNKRSIKSLKSLLLCSSPCKDIFYMMVQFVGKCCKSLRIDSNGTAGIQQAGLMGLYTYQFTDSNDQNVFKGPNNGYLSIFPNDTLWRVSSFNGITYLNFFLFF